MDPPTTGVMSQGGLDGQCHSAYARRPNDERCNADNAADVRCIVHDRTETTEMTPKLETSSNAKRTSLDEPKTRDGAVIGDECWSGTQTQEQQAISSMLRHSGDPLNGTWWHVREESTSSLFIRSLLPQHADYSR